MLKSLICFAVLFVCALDLQASFEVNGVDGEYCQLEQDNFRCSYGNIAMRLCSQDDLKSYILYEEGRILAAAAENPNDTIDNLLLNVPDVMNKTGFNTFTKNMHVHKMVETHMRGSGNLYFRFPSSMYFSLHESRDSSKLIGLMITDEINAEGNISYFYSLKQEYDEDAAHADVNLIMSQLARYLKNDLKKCVEIMQKRAHTVMQLIYDFKSFSTWSYINDAVRIQRLTSINGMYQSGLEFCQVYDHTEQGWLAAKLNALGCAHNLGLYRLAVVFRIVTPGVKQITSVPLLTLKQPFQYICTPESKHVDINRKTLRDRRKTIAEFREETLSSVPKNKPRKFSRQYFCLLTPGFYQQLATIGSWDELLVFLTREHEKYLTSDLSLSPRLSRTDHPYESFLRQVLSDE